MQEKEKARLRESRLLAPFDRGGEFKQPTGCPAVDRTTLIAPISLMPGPIIKPFDSMKVKMLRIFLVYDKSSYWLYYPILGMKLFLTRFSQKWFLCAHRPHTISKKNYALS